MIECIINSAKHISHMLRIEIIRFWTYGRYSFRLSFYQIRFMVLSSLFVIKRKDNSLKVDETPKTDKRNWSWMGKNVGKRRCVRENMRTSNTIVWGVIIVNESNYFKECIPYDYLLNLFLKPNMGKEEESRIFCSNWAHDSDWYVIL